ncbi:MAG TPA: shikimate kinase, partial [Methylomicrobium sp.]|nr:shikimate kinase [Methylomicrobium sp.]
IKQLTQMQGIVLATGGGAILREENRELLKENGFVVYLKCSIGRILERTRKDTQRPLLRTDNPRARLESLQAEREPLYLFCADFKVDTGLMQSKAVVNRILEQYRSINSEKE